MRDIWRDEEGVTTVGMVVALMVTLALIFTTAQAYRINSASAEVQEVADVAALAAENEVAEFMIAVRVCDAAVLSMSLLAVALYGLSVASLCTPASSAIAKTLMEMASKVMEARNSFARNAAKGLNALQKALPFLAAANAAAIASANNTTGALEARYFAVAVLVPSEGKDIVIEDIGSDGLEQTIKDEADDIAEAAADAEEAAEKANDAKQRAFEHDCGNNPDYCMYERADHLAGLSAATNPLYHSVDAWSFSVALKRAQAYYAARYAQESPNASDSVEDQADSVLRKRFYAWASQQLSQGYVIETEDSFEASFPTLFRNTEGLRKTSLYTEAVYPITVEGDTKTMHAWSGCPEAEGSTGMGSLRDLDAGGFTLCPSCEFRVSSMGNVASASTSISNGFEYHYAIVAEAAADYEKARLELDPLTSEVKDEAGTLIDELAEFAQKIGGTRIDAVPPGSQGVIALVVNLGDASADTGFESSFVGGEATLGTRAAVSAATLVEDGSHDGSSLVSSLLDGFGSNAGAAVGATRIALDCWSALLSAYSNGQDALEKAIERALDSIPLVGSSGLGSWASKKVSSAFEAVGLQPVELDALKPVLVNSSHVASADDGTFSVRYGQAQQAALAASSSSGDAFDALAGVAGQGILDGIGELEEDGITVAVIELPIGGVSTPITLTLPPVVDQGIKDLVSEGFDALRTLGGNVAGVKVWE